MIPFSLISGQPTSPVSPNVFISSIIFNSTYSYTTFYSGNIADPGTSVFEIGTSSNVYLHMPSSTNNHLIFRISGTSGSYIDSFTTSVASYGWGGYNGFVDSQNSVYIAGLNGAFTGGRYDGMIQKFTHTNTSSFTYSYSTNIGSFGSINGEANSIISDSSNNVYIGGWDITGSTGTYSLTKLSSTGSQTFRVRLGTGNTSSTVFSIATDGTSIYTIGNGPLRRINSSGVITSTYSNLSTNYYNNNTSNLGQQSARRLFIADSGNRYYLNDGVIYKYDSSHNLQWSRTILSVAFSQNPSSSGLQNLCIAFDKANEVIFASTGTTATQSFITAYDSNNNERLNFFVNNTNAVGYRNTVTAMKWSSPHLYIWLATNYWQLTKVQITY